MIPHLSRSGSRLRAGVAVAALLAAAACGSAPERSSTNDTAAGGTDAATATSAEEFGGMEELVEAAKKEGKLNVIALPPGLGQLRRDHQDLRARSTASRSTPRSRTRRSQDEINAAKQLKGTDRAPDVFDLGLGRRAGQQRPVRAVQGRDLGRHRRRSSRTPTGRYVSDYGGFMSIGYDAGEGAGADERRGPAQARVQGQGRAQRRPDAGRCRVQRRRDGGARQRRLAPTTSRPGVDFFARAQGRRQLPAGRPVRPRRSSPARRPSSSTGTTPTPRRPRSSTGKRDWKVVVPDGRVVGAYYKQAINKDAPHPAAARLWQEFLYSDEGQNLWLKGFGPPGARRGHGEGRHDRQGGVRRRCPRPRASRSS